MKDISALIAVRKGSKRVLNKNMRKFADSSLLEIKIRQLQRITGLDRIFVSTDCEKMKMLSENLGATVIMRDPKFASDEVPMNLVYEYLAKSIEGEHVLYVHVTSPLLKDASLQKCIDLYKKLPDAYDSLATVRTLHEYIWHDGLAVNYDPNNHPRSQDLPDYHALNFAVNLLPRSVMINRRNIVGNSFYPHPISKIESIDIDEEEDFMIAELLYERNRLLLNN